MNTNPYHVGEYIKITYPLNPALKSCTGRVKAVLEEGRAYDVFVGDVAQLPYSKVLGLPVVRLEWAEMTLLRPKREDFSLSLDMAILGLKHPEGRGKGEKN